MDPQRFRLVADVYAGVEFDLRLLAGRRRSFGRAQTTTAFFSFAGSLIVRKARWDDAGPDEAWGKPLGTLAFGPETLHDLRSVTKSVVGLLYGIALDRGLVPPLEAPLLAQFPDYPALAAVPPRARLPDAPAPTTMSRTVSIPRPAQMPRSIESQNDV